MSTGTTSIPSVVSLLEEAKVRGFLGPGPVEAHVDLARGALPLLTSASRAVDLGAGGGALELPNPPVVVAQPAEVAGRVDLLRGVFDLVLARSFGPPATTAECGAPLLRVGGILAVTEPPEATVARWPVEELGRLGLAPRDRVAAFQTLEQVSRCPDRFPRRTGVPRQRPLF